jgi:hypothetical protein
MPLREPPGCAAEAAEAGRAPSSAIRPPAASAAAVAAKPERVRRLTDLPLCFDEGARGGGPGTSDLAWPGTG